MARGRRARGVIGGRLLTLVDVAGVIARSPAPSRGVRRRPRTGWGFPGTRTGSPDEDEFGRLERLYRDTLQETDTDTTAAASSLFDDGAPDLPRVREDAG